MRRSAAAAAASIARAQRRLMLQKQRPLIEKLKTLKLTAVPSRGVRPGHAIVDLHPDVFREVEFEEKVTEEMLKKLNDLGTGAVLKDAVVGGVTKLLVTGSLLEYAMAIYGVKGRFSELGREKATEVIAKKVSNQFKLEEKMTKAKISADLEELSEIMKEIEALVGVDITKQAINAKEANNSSVLKHYGKKFLDILRGAEKVGDEK